MASKQPFVAKLGRRPNVTRRNTDKLQPSLEVIGGKFKFVFAGPVGVVNITLRDAAPMDVDPQKATAGLASAHSIHKEDEVEDDTAAGESFPF